MRSASEDDGPELWRWMVDWDMDGRIGRKAPRLTLRQWNKRWNTVLHDGVRELNGWKGSIAKRDFKCRVIGYNHVQKRGDPTGEDNALCWWVLHADTGLLMVGDRLIYPKLLPQLHFTDASLHLMDATSLLWQVSYCCLLLPTTAYIDALPHIWTDISDACLF